MEDRKVFDQFLIQKYEHVIVREPAKPPFTGIVVEVKGDAKEYPMVVIEPDASQFPVDDALVGNVETSARFCFPVKYPAGFERDLLGIFTRPADNVSDEIVVYPVTFSGSVQVTINGDGELYVGDDIEEAVEIVEAILNILKLYAKRDSSDKMNHRSCLAHMLSVLQNQNSVQPRWLVANDIYRIQSLKKADDVCAQWIKTELDQKAKRDLMLRDAEEEE